MIFWGKTHTDDDGNPAAYDLRCHLLDTAGAAFAVWDLWLRPGLKAMLTDALAPGDPEAARRIVAAVAGLHDVGKATPVFQAQALSSRPLPPVLAGVLAGQREAGLAHVLSEDVNSDPQSAARHEAATMAILGVFPSDTTERVGDRWAAAAAGGHHGRYHPGVLGECIHTKTALDALTGMPEWEQKRQEIIDLVLSATGVTTAELKRGLHAHEGAAVVLLTGLVIVADWVASDSLGLVRGYGSRTTHQVVGSDAFSRKGAGSAYVKKAERAYRRLLPSTLGVYRAPANPRTAAMGSSTIPLYPLQEAAGVTGRGLWIVKETTGSGKTEAAMLRHMTEPTESVIWGLPTRATADKMWGRVQSMYRRTRNVGALLHAHRSLDGFYLARRTDGPGLRYSPWATEVLGNIKPLLSPVAVGTVDQVLLGALRQKWNPVRLLALANAHVILDEVHLMDEYQVQLAEELLTWWGMTDTRVTMLSASLPQALTERFTRAYSGDSLEVEAVYPSHTLVHDGEAVTTALQTARSYDIDIDLRAFRPRTGETPGATMTRHAVKAVLDAREVHPTARIAVIMNRVGHVQDVAAQLLALGIPDVTAMHSRMAAGHRTGVSAELEGIAGKTSRVEGAIVVGTQVIEASLDLDFDILITELAPAPALIQRAGRQWRTSKAEHGAWSGHWHARPAERPKLTVLTLLGTDESSTVPNEALALPYSYGSISRTYTALKAFQGRLNIPDDVQAFVDAAHYDLASGEDERATGEEIVKAHQRATAAADVTIRARDRQGPFIGPLTYAKLTRLTLPDPQTESATRYADYAQVPILIVDAFTHGRWAWRGNTDDAQILRELGTRRPRDVGVLLGMTLQVPLDMLGKHLTPLIDIEHRFDRDVSPFSASELRGVVPVRLNAGVYYDERLGLTR